MYKFTAKNYRINFSGQQFSNISDHNLERFLELFPAVKLRYTGIFVGPGDESTQERNVIVKSKCSLEEYNNRTCDLTIHMNIKALKVEGAEDFMVVQMLSIILKNID